MKYECVFLLVLGCIGTCSNLLNSACGDPFNANGISALEIVEAGPGEVCAKSKVSDLVGRTAESSAACPGGTNGCTSATDGGISGTICCCTTNLCNGVSMVREHSFIIFIAMSALTILLSQWF